MIAKIYHPLYKFDYDNWSEESRGEQREYAIKNSIERMKCELNALKTQYKKSLKPQTDGAAK